MDYQPWPSELNASRAGHTLELKDKFTVRYAVDATHNNDVGAIQANHPVPSNCAVYYYELTVLDQGRAGKIAIGFADKSFKLTRQPGWEMGSYGYHGDDGKKFISSGIGEEYGPTFTVGDTVGAGIHLGRQELFFTKNGTKLKVAHRPIRAGLYPTIGLHSKGEMVQVNFGQKPWVFDLEGMLAEEKAAQRAAVERIPMSPGTTHKLVRQYLLHYGYEETLRAFDKAAGLAAEDVEGLARAAASAATATEAKQDGATALALRASLRRALLAGEVDQALALLTEQCPAVLADPGRFGDVHFQLACQKYIELVRRGCIQDAVVFAQGTLARLRGPSAADLEASLRDVVALVAYQHPESSPLAHLLGQAQRDAVADAVNAAVLAALASPQGHAPAARRRKSRSGSGTASVSGMGSGDEDEDDDDDEVEEAEEEVDIEAATAGRRSSGGSGGGREGERPGGSEGSGSGGDGGLGAVSGDLTLQPALWPAEQLAAAMRPASHVEALLRQLVAVQAALQEANGGQGGVFNLQEYMLGPMK